MRALVVVESSFGNTRKVAEAVAVGLGPDTVVVDVAGAPHHLDDDLDLVVVGGPTHAFGMSRPATRADAARQAGVNGSDDPGLREWIDLVEGRPRCAVATFDTKVTKARHLPGAAAKGAAKALKARAFRVVDAPHTFYVTDTPGPLAEGELERARAWGTKLAARP
jgi:hypothetical protein